MKSQYDAQGFCTFPNVLSTAQVSDLNQIVNELLALQSHEHFEAQKSSGSMINVKDDERFAPLIAHPKALDCLSQLDFLSPKWSSGFIISKPGFSPALFWHQDWWGWSHERSYQKPTQMAFLMYYLVDTNRKNGCLRLIPNSHTKRHPLHDVLTAPHAEYRELKDPEHPAYQDAVGEIDVEVAAGDLIVGDARLLHAAHANQTKERRSVITLWFFPNFETMPLDLQASIDPTGRHGWPETWSSEALKVIEDLKPHVPEATPLSWNRIPDQRLQ